MSLIATAVKHLIAAGVTGDALLTAIAELELQVRAEPKPRSAGAARQARYEERKRQKASEASELTLSDGNDGSDAFGGNTSLPLPPNENNSNPPTPTHPEGTTGASEPDGTLPDAAAPISVKPSKARGKRPVADAVPIPAGWEPSFTPAAQTIVDGWPPGMLARERMAFEAHAASTDRVTKDWQAAFRTWIARAEQYRTERNGDRSTGTGRGFAGGHQPDKRDGFTRSLDDTIQRGRGGAAPLQ